MSSYSQLINRAITASALAMVVLSGLYFLPNILWAALLLIPLAVASLEVGRLFSWTSRGRTTLLILSTFFCGVSYVAPWVMSYEFTQIVVMLSIASLLFWLFFVPYFLRIRARVTSRYLQVAIYAIIFLPTWASLVALQNQPDLAALAIAAVCLVDISGYVFGKWIGRHRLAKTISPGKTIEGLVGGVVTVFTFGVLLSWVGDVGDLGAHTLTILITAVGFTVLCVLGDLVESYLKRLAGVKNSGTILPGHGGLYDRIDGMTAILPTVFLVTHWML
jgi:phosphatidate cytidylyltransferase